MSEPHIQSYYSATAGPFPAYPKLEGDVKADVCVIGGGLSGLSTAITLAERGYKVVILEANRIGWGASGRNGGQLIAGMSGEANLIGQLGEDGRKLVRDIRYRGHEIVAERIAKYGIDCDMQLGWMEAAAREKHMKGLRSYHQEMIAEGHGDHFELIEKKDLPSVTGSDAYFGALVDRRSGHLHPLKLCLGEARAASALGVAIYEDSTVVDFGGGAKPYARTAAGRVDASAIVLAGDALHTFQRGKLKGQLLPTGSYIITTEPVGDNLVKKLDPQHLALADSNIVLDYFRFTADRRLLFGGRCNYTNRDPRDLTASMRPRLERIFPELKGIKIDYAWGGRIGIVLTRIPAIGRLEPNVYYMQGYCGHGLNVTHIAGEIVADGICGTMERLDLFDRVRHWQLPVGRWAGNQMLALGMLYYRMKDAL